MKKFLLTLLFAAFLMPMAANAQCTDGTPCQFTIVGEDTYGDGWEGTLTIYRNNVQMGTFEVDEDEYTQVYTVCAGDVVRIEWSGSDQYGENFFTISSNGVTLVNYAAGEDYAPSGTVIEFAACPSCSAVTGVTVSNLVSDGCTISWTDANNTGATYTIYDMSDTSVVVSGLTSTTYTFTNLDDATSYVMGIVANCSATDESTITPVSFFTPCLSLSLPLNEGFSANSATLGCWSFVATGNIGGTYGAGLVEVDGNTAFRFSSYSSADDYNQYLYTPVFDVSSSATGLGVSVRYATYGSNDKLKFGYITATDTVWDPTEYTTTGSTDWQIYSVPVPTTAVRMVVHYYGSYSYYAWIDSVSITEMSGDFCYPISNLTAGNISSEGATLTWSDANNSGATYTVYNMADSSVVATGISDTTYTVENLTPNTSYTFAVVTNCSSSNESDGVAVTFRTSCAPVALPFVETFDATLSSDPCWRGSSSATADEVFGGATLNLGNNNSWTYASSVSNGIEAGHYRVNIYGSSCKKWMVTPEIDLSTASNPVLQFDVAFTAYSGTNAASGYDNNATQAFIVAFSTDDGLTWDSTSAVRWQNNGGQHTLAEIASTSYANQTINLSQFVGDTIRIAFYCQSTTSGGDNNLHLDNIYVDEAPSCFPVGGLTATNVTDNSLTLNWSDTINSGATYTIYNMADTSVVAANVSATTYSVTGLTPNTSYSFGVEVNCSATDMARIMTVSARTQCGVEMLPFTMNFDASISSDPCWRGASNATAAQVFAGTALTLGNPSNWSFTSSDRDGLAGGHYYKNVYGSSVKSWMITPSIDLSNATNAQLSFDVALTDYNNAALPDANGDTNNSQAFMVIISTDGGNTWDSTDATIWQNVGGDYTYASLASLTYQNKVIDLSQYAGDTIKIAFYCQSLWSGGDNDLHLDNISVTGTVDTTVIPTTYTVTAVANDTTMGEVFYVDMPYEAGDTAFVMAMPNPGYRFVEWTEGTTVVSTDAMYEFVVTRNVSLVANFEVDSTSSADSLTIVIDVNDAVMGTVTPAPGTYRYAEGEVYTLTATPNSGYYFGGWIYTLDLGFMVFSDTLFGYPATITDTVTESDLGMVLGFTALFTADSVPVVNFDSIVVTLAVNDPTMGTITPAPGTYTYSENDSIHVAATAFDGYQFVGWMVNATMLGESFDTTIYTTENAFDESFEEMGGMVMTITALFAADTVGPQPTMYTVAVTVNNATMGTVSGAGVYAEGSTVNLTATANEGYTFVGWVIDGDTITDNPYSFTITANVNAVAVFAANTGIEDADMANVNVYSADSRIIVNGAEGREINVYDLNGRTVSSMRSAGENVEFRMANTGVYLVKVGNAAAKRVVVIR